jgi:flavodoxin
MKALVVYYSRTGITKQVAQAVADALSGRQDNEVDVEEVIDTKDRSGAMGYVLAGKDAAMKVNTPIRPVRYNPADYDLVIVGTPVWAFNVSAPIRSYLTERGQSAKRVAFFCTMGGSGDQRALAEMEALAGKKPLAVLTVLEKTVKSGGFRDAAGGFVQTLQTATI